MTNKADSLLEIVELFLKVSCFSFDFAGHKANPHLFSVTQKYLKSVNSLMVDNKDSDEDFQDCVDDVNQSKCSERSILYNEQARFA